MHGVVELDKLHKRNLFYIALQGKYVYYIMLLPIIQLLRLYNGAMDWIIEGALKTSV